MTKSTTGYTWNEMEMICTHMFDLITTLHVSSGEEVGSPTSVPNTEEGSQSDCCLAGSEPP